MTINHKPSVKSAGGFLSVRAVYKTWVIHMFQEGEINIAQCENCEETFPVFIFIADTDMVTSGCVALTNKNGNITLTMCAPNESIEQIETRVGAGYHVVQVRYENPVVRPSSSFQEFRKNYKPAEHIYTCIHCGSDAYVIKKETKHQYLRHGFIDIKGNS